MSPKKWSSATARDGSPGKEGAFARLVSSAANGSELAARHLYARHKGRVAAVVRRRLREFRDVLDSEAVAQDAWAAIFASVKNGEKFVDELAFVHFVGKVAADSSGMALRSRFAQRRSPRREVPLNSNAKSLVDDEPGPAEIAEAADEWHHRLAQMCPIARAVFDRIESGLSLREIAVDLALSLRTIQRCVAAERHER